MFNLDLLSSKPQKTMQKDALKGRETPLAVPQFHYVNGHALKGPWPDDMKTIILAMGCFWGVERLFWQTPGVYVTSAGYSGGYTANPTYEEVCSGRTGHSEVVMVVYDPKHISLDQLLQIFWQEHDPTQGMQQGNDIGTQYRSAIYITEPEDQTLIENSRNAYQQALNANGLGQITTEIETAGAYYYAEDYHQQYLAKNPNGYCGLKGTGVNCPISLRTS